jgi:hypothetical protein
MPQLEILHPMSYDIADRVHLYGNWFGRFPKEGGMLLSFEKENQVLKTMFLDEIESMGFIRKINNLKKEG